MPYVRALAVSVLSSDFNYIIITYLCCKPERLHLYFSALRAKYRLLYHFDALRSA